ncbi:Transmembrane protein [Schistosoma japonicum]|uniref:Transmembrane protein n=1 Tax=Schistosoma japonicum TaxID=6182 RepID=A0A4Z2DBI2_SCHJA|nr:Transmembrane protein [Schistosoma japonicum]
MSLPNFPGNYYPTVTSTQELRRISALTHQGFFTFTKDICKLTLYDCEKFLALNIPSIVLIGLRLDDYINWTWILVLMPFWITMGFIIVLLLLLICMLCGLSRFTQKDLHDIIFIIVCSSIAFTFLTFVILLVCRLDNIKLFTYNEIFLPLIICIIFMLIVTIFIEWLMSRVSENTNGPTERNCTMEYISGSRSLKTTSHDRSSDFHDDSTGRISSGSFENNLGTVVSFNTDANNSNLINKEMHFLYSNKLNQPIINENSISLPD